MKTNEIKQSLWQFAFICMVSLMYGCKDDPEPVTMVASFSESSFNLDPQSAWFGQDKSGTRSEEERFGSTVVLYKSTFTTSGVSFDNEYNKTWGSWSGWSYSNKTDINTPGFQNQHSTFAGSPPPGASVFAVAFGDVDVNFDQEGGVSVQEVLITNTTYAGLSMRDGDQFAKKFGGASGDDPDYFLLTIKGLNASGAETGSVEFYLADYRGSTNLIVNAWEPVDLSILGRVHGLRFSLSSSDTGDFGMNTPATFCLGNVKYIP
jgi:hypothetical protein